MKTTRVICTLLVSVFVVTTLTGCVAVAVGGAVAYAVHRKKVKDLKSDSEVLAYRREMSAAFANNPDTDAWHEQRQKIALAVGDRIFEQDFARVFDSLVQAAATLELKVSNMERTSGYVSATGVALTPSESKEMRRAMVNEWCKLNNFDPAVFDRPLKTPEMIRMAAIVDFNGMMARYEKAQRGLTFQLVRMGEKQTKVKLRFSEVYYPAEVETYYKLVWQAVDKQIFVDQNIEGSVEKRK